MEHASLELSRKIILENMAVVLMHILNFYRQINQEQSIMLPRIYMLK